MNVILDQIIGSFIFWAIAGALLAFVFTQLQKRSLSHLSADEPQKVLAQTMGQSALRVVISVAVLFFAFKSGLVNGLVCLGIYLVIRWIWTFAYLRKFKKENLKE
jgi:membrane protein insertase Oxa1/YidC/SpoIIIJ